MFFAEFKATEVTSADVIHLDQGDAKFRGGRRKLIGWVKDVKLKLRPTVTSQYSHWLK